MTSTSSAAHGEGGRIVVRTGFANLLRRRSIPGSRWDQGRKARTYPATACRAHIIRSSFPCLETTEQFQALLGDKALSALQAAAPPPGSRSRQRRSLPSSRPA